MRYTYRCDVCRASAPSRGSRADARADRDDHRDRAHHGLSPDDGIDQTPGPVDQLITHALNRAAARARGERRSSRDHPDAQPAIRQATLLLAAGAAVIILLGLLIR
ncbi:hypothetical protein [Streptomyces sulfonofaciens]|uniref:hypothetical protein n=1 Tax=Streptomyces sulfonofaciens TaxID=68272 RepID=UPI001674892F|nr:hypothetical protein [Streptomyces sulfonofaciens]